MRLEQVSYCFRSSTALIPNQVRSHMEQNNNLSYWSIATWNSITNQFSDSVLLGYRASVALISRRYYFTSTCN